MLMYLFNACSVSVQSKVTAHSWVVFAKLFLVTAFISFFYLKCWAIPALDKLRLIFKEMFIWEKHSRPIYVFFVQFVDYMYCIPSGLDTGA